MTSLVDLRRDLRDEQLALDAIVVEMTNEQWSNATASPGWSVADQIGHLAYFDRTAATAITDPVAFALNVEELHRSSARNLEAADQLTLGWFRNLGSSEQLASWRANRELLADACATLGETDRVIWYGPSMSAKSFLTARLMEVWAHGRDIAQAVEAKPVATDRLRHIAQLGCITRGWSYTVRGEPTPSAEICVMLQSPSHETWTWGPTDAPDVVTGSAEEFCLVVTQRIHVDDTGLQFGDAGREWLVHAQAFAGRSTQGPAPRSL